ncbi:hypothetical protein BX616_003517 [Lobosporangium transversale]|nr:hypothetical protein BX616_003517 [Lobosporangium transversale]
MSSPGKDFNSEGDVRPPSDLNVLPDSETPATLNVVSPATEVAASKKPPGSPQVTAEDSFHEDAGNLELHSSVAQPGATTNDNAPADTQQSNGSATVVPVAPVAPLASVASVAPITQTTTTAPATAEVPTDGNITTPAASEREAKLAILTEAFPTVEKEVCEFVLESHRGNVEASINALLEISDPEFRPEPQQAVVPPHLAPAPTSNATVSNVPPALPRRQTHDSLTQGVDNLSLGQNQNQNQNRPQAELDPIFLASTSTSEQQLRADEDYARTLAAMEEYRARERQNVHNQQGQQQNHQEQEGPSFTQEFKELMDEELPKIKERFNVAADTTKKKVTEWYNQFKASRAEAAQRNNQHQNQQQDSEHWLRHDDANPTRYESRLDDDAPLARPYDINSQPLASEATEPVSNSTNTRRTTLEDGF